MKRLKLVGDFIRKRREALRMSQRALGMLFTPAVSTQFISNVERGVTPLPPVHVPILAKALMTPDSEIMNLLEKEYALKLNGRLGKSLESVPAEGALPTLVVASEDYQFVRSLYDAYRSSDHKTKQAFATVCESILKVPKTVLPT
ncbi:MAG: helix-turn-helix domain-containing protein [Bdellovibrio sp.]|nr:helix-turn-helix domain-containing protein [Bdellovibrio sp.]